LAKDLRLKPVYAMGHLHALWHDALEQQEDGDLSSWSDEMIADAAQFQGNASEFVRLLQLHGWLDGKLIHDWLDYAGRYLDTKYRTSKPDLWNEIKARHTKARQESVSSPTKVSPPNRTEPTEPKEKSPPSGGTSFKKPESPHKIDLSGIQIPDCGGKAALSEAAKHKLYNRVLKVLENRGWTSLNGMVLSVFRAVSDRVKAAKPGSAYPYFEMALMNYVNENADALAAQARLENRKQPVVHQSVGDTLARFAHAS
jgi:hypothetical protein